MSIGIEIFSDGDFMGFHQMSVFLNRVPKFPFVKLRSRQPSYFTLTPITTGVVKFSISPKPNSKIKFQPQERTVLVRENADLSRQNSYFDTLQLSRGTLRKGCCSATEATYTCQNAKPIAIKSACSWSFTRMRRLPRAPGVVHAEVDDFSLPVSVAGYRLTNKGVAIRWPNPEVCTPCDSVMPLCDSAPPFNDTCCYYDLQESDTADFINSRALALTYINNIQDLLPSWLKMRVDLSFARQTSPFSEDDYFAQILPPKIDVSTQTGCEKINAMTNGFYSVLRYDKTISAEIGNQSYTYKENSETGSRYDPMCIAVNLCQVPNSSVFIQPSQPVHDILVSHHLMNFISKGWEIQINALSVSQPRMFERSEEQYWNGVQMVAPLPMQADVSINANIKSIFNSKHLNIALEFTGDAEFLYEVRFAW